MVLVPTLNVLEILLQKHIRIDLPRRRYCYFTAHMIERLSIFIFIKTSLCDAYKF
jgi:hypothetical protein